MCAPAPRVTCAPASSRQAALAAAAESDFPARWPHLPSALDDRLHGAWAADDIEGVVFALQCARVTIRACAAAPVRPLLPLR